MAELIENIKNGKCQLINKNWITKDLVDAKDVYQSINECHVFTEQDLFANTISIEQLKQAREEIENINPVYSTIGDRIPVLKNCDDIKAEVLEILNKLIAESET